MNVSRDSLTGTRSDTPRRRRTRRRWDAATQASQLMDGIIWSIRARTPNNESGGGDGDADRASDMRPGCKNKSTREIQYFWHLKHAHKDVFHDGMDTFLKIHFAKAPRATSWNIPRIKSSLIPRSYRKGTKKAALAFFEELEPMPLGVDYWVCQRVSNLKKCFMDSIFLSWTM